MLKKVTRYRLPFSILSGDRTRAFTKDMELASIFCIAEMERKKGVEFILKRPAEEINFIVQAAYPLFLVPEKGRALLFDGFGFHSHILRYDVLPAVETFINSFKRGSRTTHSFQTTLTQNLDYFDSFAGVDEKKIRGLIADSELNQTFSSLLKRARRIKKPIKDKIILSPSLDLEVVQDLIGEIVNFRKRLQTDIQKLQKAMRTVDNLTEKFVGKIKKKIQNLKKTYDRRIKKTREVVTRKIEVLEKKFNDELIHFGKKFERELQDLNKEQIKLQKRREELLKEKGEYETKIKGWDKKGDPKEIWNMQEKITQIDQKLEELKKEIKTLSEEIEETQKRRDEEFSRLSSEHKDRINSLKEKIEEKEAELDAKVKIQEENINFLHDHASTITARIKKLLDLKSRALAEFEEIGMKKRIRKIFLFYIPLYMICFSRLAERRYVYVPISNVISMRVLDKVKTLIGLSGVKSLLKPFPKIEDMIKEFATLVKSNPLFENEIAEMGVKLNAMKNRLSRKRIERGLTKIKNEGWFSENELVELKNSLSRV